jgi:hypothetical protein
MSGERTSRHSPESTPLNTRCSADHFPYGESPKNVSDVTLAVMRSRVLTIVTSWVLLIVMLVSSDTIGQRPDILVLVVDDVHSRSLLCDMCLENSMITPAPPVQRRAGHTRS